MNAVIETINICESGSLKRLNEPNIQHTQSNYNDIPDYPSSLAVSPRLEYSAQFGNETPYTTKRREDKSVYFLPEFENINISSSMITTTIRRLLKNYWAIVVSKALQSSFPISKTAISIFKDPGSGQKQVVLQVFTDANASQSLAFWDGLSKDIDLWLASLSERYRLVFMKDISMRMHWQ
jgi:hypothetical protein